MCFVDLGKVMTMCPQGIPWGALQEYGVSEAAPTNHPVQSESFVHIFGKKSNTFPVGFGSWILPLISDHVCDIYGQNLKAVSGCDECVRYGVLRIMSLLFTDNVVLLASMTSSLHWDCWQPISLLCTSLHLQMNDVRWLTNILTITEVTFRI